MAFESLSITGSLRGTGSWAVSASRPSNGFYYPRTENVIISGSSTLGTSGSLTVNGAYTYFNDFVLAQATTTTIGLGTDINFAFSSVSGSEITYAAPFFTLKGGRKYYLTFEASTTGWSTNTSNATVTFVNNTNTAIGTVATSAYLTAIPTTTQTTLLQQFGAALIEPATDTQVKLRVTAATGTGNLIPSGSYLTIQRIY